MTEAADPTLTSDVTVAAPLSRPSAAAVSSSFDTTTRYIAGDLLGVGGMGEVRLSVDTWVGRSVAMKVALASSADARARFLREARVQGQLEHPNVVPVYDIGRGARGEPFFTMKRISGHTLDEVIEALRADDRRMVALYTRRKLLAAMSQICLTVAYAHSREVVHRDLKPANVMLGDFGEVYLLDWGIAKALGSSDDASARPDASDDGQTAVGAMVGTLGYMSPEQVRGDPIGPAADIYALGAMLFEVLTLERLHAQRNVTALVDSTLQPTAAPSARGSGEVPPELDAICLRATALEPRNRFESAREMQEAIERYLDGERDAERRKELATAHVGRARERMTAAESATGAEAERLRADGLRELGRAVALDPADRAAISALSELLLAPHDEHLPAEARAELEATAARDRAAAARRVTFMYVGWLALIPLTFIEGVKSWPAIITMTTVAVITIVYTAWMAKQHVGSPQVLVALVLNFALVGAASTIFGPLIFAPAVATTSAISLSLAYRARPSLQRAAFGLAVVSIFVPILLQLVGVMPSPYAIEGDRLVVNSVACHFPPDVTLFGLGAVTLVQLLIPAIMIRRATDTLSRAERRNFVQAWRLRHLLPADSFDPPRSQNT